MCDFHIIWVLFETSELLRSLRCWGNDGRTNLANEATTPGHKITADATHSALCLYTGFGGPFWVNSICAYSGDTPVMYDLRVATMTCGSIGQKDNINGREGTYSQRNRICKSHERHNYRTCLPRHSNRLALRSLGPEQVEEETRPKDRSYSNPDKDII